MANAYIDKNGQKELVLKEVARLHIESGSIVLETLFGENKIIQGKIKKIDFVNSKILLKGKQQ